MSWRAKLVIWAIVLGVFVLVFMPLWLPLLPDRWFADRYYVFPRVEIDATVHQDGSMSVLERRTFDFQKGDFSFAFREFRPDYPGQIIDFSVSDDVHGPYTGDDLVIEEFAGTYKATWYYSAHDEQRTFDIRYTARCAVGAFADGAFLYWQFIPDGFDKPTEAARITVHLPGHAAEERSPGPCTAGNEPNAGRTAPETPLADGETRAWGHGPLQGNVRVIDPQTVELTIRDLEPNRFVEGSVLFPADAVPFEGIALSANGPDPDDRIVQSAAEVLAQERALAAEANATRSHVRAWDRGWKLAALLYPLLLALLVLVARWRDRVPGVPKTLPDPPEEIHPVDLAVLWEGYERGSRLDDAYRAQLLSLAQKGTIEVVAEGRVSDADDLSIRKRQRPEPGLDERFTEFLFDGSGDGPVKLSWLKASGVRARRAKEMREWARPVWKSLAKMADLRSLRFEGVTSFLAMLAMIVVGITAAVVVHRGLAAWVGIVEGLVLFAVSRSFMPTQIEDPVHHERIARWEAFRRYLLRFHTLTDAPALAVTIWERYLVYATALGIADRVVAQIQALVPAELLPSPFRGAPPGPLGLSWVRTFSTAPSAAGYASIAS
ncbi:MAG TPA: DUF2207 domain-containing protein, partial [Actinomycetota bacterium]|nr:DUF2207 domain-containing protein [Actinomycetota bacterium]